MTRIHRVKLKNQWENQTFGYAGTVVGRWQANLLIFVVQMAFPFGKRKKHQHVFSWLVECRHRPKKKTTTNWCFMFSCFTIACFLLAQCTYTYIKFRCMNTRIFVIFATDPRAHLSPSLSLSLCVLYLFSILFLRVCCIRRLCIYMCVCVYVRECLHV